MADDLYVDINDGEGTKCMIDLKNSPGKQTTNKTKSLTDIEQGYLVFHIFNR